MKMTHIHTTIFPHKGFGGAVNPLNIISGVFGILIYVGIMWLAFFVN